jgi:hypothetical protein
LSPRISHVNESFAGTKLFNTENHVCVAVNEIFIIRSVVSTILAGSTCLHNRTCMISVVLNQDIPDRILR